MTNLWTTVTSTIQKWDVWLLTLINKQWTSPLLDWSMPILSSVKFWLILGMLLFTFAIVSRTSLQCSQPDSN